MAINFMHNILFFFLMNDFFFVFLILYLNFFVYSLLFAHFHGWWQKYLGVGVYVCLNVCICCVMLDFYHFYSSLEMMENWMKRYFNEWFLKWDVYCFYFFKNSGKLLKEFIKMHEFSCLRRFMSLSLRIAKWKKWRFF